VPGGVFGLESSGLAHTVPNKMRKIPTTLVLLTFFCCAAPANCQWWSLQTSGIDTNLRGVSGVFAPDSKGEPVPVVWASGSNGVVLRSVDLGKTWRRFHVQGGDALDFRGIAAVDAKIAYVMSSGNGEKSRIYKTVDGGATWNLQYRDARRDFFLDAISCGGTKYCFALGDPIDGKFLVLATEDGEHWKELPRDTLPAALPNEGAFAASGSCLSVYDDDIYFGTGGPAARVFHSPDSGRTWTVTQTPIASGNASSGIFSLGGGWRHILFAVGGDYMQPTRPYHAAAVSEDGGKTWQLSKQPPGGFRSAVATLDGITAVAVGPNGEDITLDQGVRWKHTDSLNLNAVAILDDQDGWAVGPNGTIARFVNHLQYNISYRRGPINRRRAETGF
jgi:photosystem II stability/assembly factor-like uncharacterized protein